MSVFVFILLSFETYQEFVVLQLQFCQIIVVGSFTGRRDLTLRRREARNT